MIGDPSRGHVVLLGDSHAAQWIEPVESIATARGWATELLLKGGCPLPQITVVPAQLGRPFTECDTWRAATLNRLVAENARQKPSVVFVSALDRYSTDAAEVLAGWRAVLQRLRALGVPVVYLRDSPYPGRDVPACLSGALPAWTPCAFPRAPAQPADPLAKAIATHQVSGVRMVDVNAVVCPPVPATCPAVLGGTVLYRDASHLTNTAMRLLTPVIEASLVRQGVLAR